MKNYQWNILRFLSSPGFTDYRKCLKKVVQIIRKIIKKCFLYGSGYGSKIRYWLMNAV